MILFGQDALRRAIQEFVAIITSSEIIRGFATGSSFQ
jgi:hypothetical protein